MTKLFFSIPLGNSHLCIERVGEQGSGRNHYAHVTLREKRPPGSRDDWKPGAVVLRDGLQRTAMLSIGLSFLAGADLMEPEQTYDTSRHFANPRRPLLRLPDSVLTQLNNKIGPGETQRAYSARHRAILSRMHILQRCQRLLETCTDADAAVIDQVLTGIETTPALAEGGAALEAALAAASGEWNGHAAAQELRNGPGATRGTNRDDLT